MPGPGQQDGDIGGASPEGAARPVVGVLLAGGQARRMGGGDKCLRRLGARPILEHVIERARPQVAALVLNANSDPSRFAAFGLPVVGDVIADFAGPLAGVLTGMEWARAHRPECPWIATIATDTPFFPDLVGRLLAAVDADGADLACAGVGRPRPPGVRPWPVRLAPDLRAAMVDEGLRKVDVWTARHRLAEVSFATDPIDPSLQHQPARGPRRGRASAARRATRVAYRKSAAIVQSSRTAQSRDLPTGSAPAGTPGRYQTGNARRKFGVRPVD